MTTLLNELILISQSNADLSLWPLIAASTLAAGMILSRRRPD
ncbi:MAG: hypothetical protein ACM3VZ_09375 [Acidobacteriota bacterium]